jgi:hypothetical protein
MRVKFTCLAFALAAAAATAQTEYTSDGVPTQRAEEVRWLLNRARFNPTAENSSRGTNYGGLSVRPPLAPNAILINAATYHATDMAAANLMTHDTLSNSSFFNWTAHRATTNIADFSERAVDLGYPMNGGAENVAYGYATSHDIYLAWWNSAGHRANYFADLREIGIGSGQRGSTIFDSMTLANRNAVTGFFTGTVFRDANSNGIYNAGEAISRMRIELTNNRVAHTSYDISSGVGSFAVPLTGINAGAVVQVFLRNNSAAPVTISIPANHTTVNPVTVPANGRWLLGSFSRVANANAGFRNLTPAASQPGGLILPRVTIATASGRAVISFPSVTGHTYQVQWSSNLSAPWTNLGSLQSGNGATISLTDTTTTVSSTPRRFYRIVVTAP